MGCVGALVLTFTGAVGVWAFGRHADCPRRLTYGSANTLAISPNGGFGAATWIYAGDLLQPRNYRTSVFDLETGAELASMVENALDMSWVDDQRLRYIKVDGRPVDVRQNEVRQWNYVTGVDELVLPCPDCRGIAMTDDGRYALAIGSRPDNSILEIRQSLASESSLSVNLSGWHPRWSPDGNRVALARVGYLLIYDVASTKIFTIAGDFAPPFDAKPLWLSNSEIVVGDVDGRSPPRTMNVEDPSQATRALPTGQILGSRYEGIVNIEISRDGKRYLMQMAHGDVVTADDRCFTSN